MTTSLLILGVSKALKFNLNYIFYLYIYIFSFKNAECNSLLEIIKRKKVKQMQQESDQNSPIRVNISRKVDRNLKNDLEKLERVSNTASTLKSERTSLTKSATKR